MIKFLEKIRFHNFCILLLFISSFILVTNKIIVVYKETHEDIKINDIVSSNSTIRKYKSDYVGVLEIPRIDLKKGLVDINSKYNNVDKNIQVLSSDISNIENDTIILAAHSGNGYKAFFKNLDKLVIGDIAHIYYNRNKYRYVVSKIYTEVKDGNIEISDNSNLLVLTTCFGKDKQLVVMLEKDYDFIS